MMLEGRNLHWAVHGRTVLDSVNLALDHGECVGLIGPNGSGKSTLLRMLYRALQPTHGNVLLLDRDIRGITDRDFARKVAVLTQESVPGFDMTVAELVMMGRFPHQANWARDSERDHAVVREALTQVGALSLADRTLADLSGGEKQRVLLARALAQEPEVLLLDEPTNHLDVRYQLEVMNLLKRLRLSAIVALHDLNIAAHYCDRLMLIDQGQVVAEGSPVSVLTPDTIQHVYGVAAEVDTHPVTQRPRISFIP